MSTIDAASRHDLTDRQWELLEPLLPRGADQLDDLGIAQRPLRRWPVTGLVVGGRGDLDPMLGQHATDRLDPELLTVFVDERGQYLDGRSSSAAKKAEADFKISFARRSSATSFFSSRISAISALVLPGR